MGLLNIGMLTRFLADPVISGFTVGASIHVFTSQLKYCFGFDIPTFHGAFYLVNVITHIFFHFYLYNPFIKSYDIFLLGQFYHRACLTCGIVLHNHKY